MLLASLFWEQVFTEVEFLLDLPQPNRNGIVARLFNEQKSMFLLEPQ